MGTLGARTNTENKDFEPIRFISSNRTYYSFSYHTFIGISHDRSLQINEKENEFQKKTLLAVKKSKWCYCCCCYVACSSKFDNSSRNES